jgi:hypothetical protein
VSIRLHKCSISAITLENSRVFPRQSKSFASIYFSQVQYISQACLSRRVMPEHKLDAIACNLCDAICISPPLSH